MPTRHYALKKDPREESREPADPFAAETPVRKTFTVSEIAAQVHRLFEETFAYNLYVEGEISDPKAYPSGHLYFGLKDANASLKAVMWRDSARRMRFTPEQGLQVICCGRLTFYSPRGEVKLEVLSMEPKGMGALQLAFEQLKEKLQKEGLFAGERKRPLPVFPERIGIVTSPQGAAIDDMLRILRGQAQVFLRPVRVQGDAAAEAIAAGICQLNTLEGLDLIIAGRGGGSIEDLWAFNEETVARSIFASRLPVISAVGHEKDWTIADLVADVRAPTPTKAAEIVLTQRRGALDRLAALLEEPAFVQPDEWLQELSEKTEELGVELITGLEQPFLSAAHRIKALHGDLLGCSPQAMILHQAERLRRLQGTLSAGMAHQLRQTADRVHGFAGRLHALSPLAVLDRGYSITFDEAGRIVKESKQVQVGDRVKTRLARGQMTSRVEEISEK